MARRIADRLGEHGIYVETYYCPHPPDDNCECRKPHPYLLLRAAHDLDLDLTRSYMIGDRLTDVEAGIAAGCKTILLAQSDVSGTSPPGLSPDYVCPDWRCISRSDCTRARLADCRGEREGLNFFRPAFQAAIGYLPKGEAT